jgi:ribosomal protein L16 Arg81 hydroxylase
MTASDLSFGDLISPMAPEQFHGEVFDKTWLHIEAKDRTRFDHLMSWQTLNDMLNMRVWTDRTITVVMDKTKLPHEAYCQSAQDRNHQAVLQPDPHQVMTWCQRGASLVLNEIETLSPPLRHLANIVQAALGAKVSLNLYCSWQAHQAFDAHYDRHDVFALQIIGQKRWHVYRGRANQPIEHAMFANILQDQYDQQKGAIQQDVVMRPGDLIYLPRGQFHDALAEVGPSIHLTLSCNAPNGLDWLTILFDQAAMDPDFRRNLPLPNMEPSPSGPDPFAQHLNALAQKFAAMAQDPELVGQLQDMRRHFGTSLPAYEIMTKDDKG